MLAHPVVERMQIPVRGLTHAGVLRAFDQLRRTLARSVSGSEGVFAGFNHLELVPIPDVAAGEVEVSALLIETAQDRLVVEYTAELLGGPCVERVTAPRHVVARGSGLTVAIVNTGGRRTPILRFGREQGRQLSEAHVVVSGERL